MALGNAQVSVGTTATLLSATETDDRSGSSIAVKVPSGAAAAVFVGKSDVTTATGFSVAVGESVALDLQPGEALYGIVASGTVTVHVLRSGV